MCTINEVRAAESKMNIILDALKSSNTEDPNYLGTELKTASDEYARAVRDLEWT